MIRKELNGVVWLEFELLSDFKRLKHGVFLRHGGVSQTPFNSLNVSMSSGDSAQHVAINQHKISEIIGLPLSGINLQHGKEIFQIDKLPLTQNPNCDAITTRTSGLGLMITHADCQAAIIYDPEHHAVANVHSGWRGSVQNIYAETIKFMSLHYNSNPSQLRVGISPSLGPEESEFINYKKELPEHFLDYLVKPTYFDFWKISQQQLENTGVLKEHIQIAKISTYTNPEDYFSYRRDKTCGRNATVTGLL
jgi:YfiH family protein